MYYKHDNGFVRLNTKFVQGGPTEFNPLKLPYHTIRIKYNGSINQNTSLRNKVTAYYPGNIYDLYLGTTNNWNTIFFDDDNLLEVLGANSKGVTSTVGMFHGCNNVTGISTFDTSKVISTYQMFYFCPNLKSVGPYPLNEDINAGYMFYGCSNLSSIPDFGDTKLTSCVAMFDNCKNLQSAPSLDTSDVTSTYMMFEGCSSMTSVPFYDTHNVLSSNRMFYDCHSLVHSPTFNLTKVTDMSYMYTHCSVLSSVPLFNTTFTYKTGNMTQAFYNCVNVQQGALALYNRVGNVLTRASAHNGTFRNCGVNTVNGAAELAQIPSDWK